MSELKIHISNKNEFVRLCGDLGVPTLSTWSGTGAAAFREITSDLNPTQSYIFKPAADRVGLDDERRLFVVADSVQALVSNVIAQGAVDFSFQIQEYVDFRRQRVSYYNMAFAITEEGVKEHLTSEQIVNVAGIHHNLNTLHWGNASVCKGDMLKRGEDRARELVQAYAEMGFNGELGIDFGIAEERLFFLETNARINNGTRLFYDLQAMGETPHDVSYLHMRDYAYELSGIAPDAISLEQEFRVRRSGGRTLLIHDNAEVIEELKLAVRRHTHASIPVPY